ANYTPPANAAVWDLGDLKPTPGMLMFTCFTTFKSGQISKAQFSIEVGIRSDDAILLGWINQNGVTLPPADSWWVTKVFDPNGVVVDSPDALVVLFQLSQFYPNPK